MSYHAYLYIDGYEVSWCPSTPDPFLLSLFTESDGLDYEMPDDYKMPWGGRSVEECRAEVARLRLIDPQWEDISEVHALVSTVSRVRDRLDVLGFDMASARATFAAGIDIRQEEIKNWKSLEDSEGLEFDDYSFDEWQAELRILKNLKATSRYSANFKECSGLARFILDANGDLRELDWGFPLADPRYRLRAFLDLCEDDSPVIYDLTQLCDGPIADEHDLFDHSCIDDERILVLTEGKTDQRFLAATLEILYPHLADCFSFFDLAEVNLQGGAAALVAMLKAFIGAKIANRIVAIFDNDTAARSARRGLERTTLPENVRVLHYPWLPLAENYPTIGPSGLSLLNINGLAGSLEVYFGIDVLQGVDGLMPVQWKGYEQAMGQYQGEVLNKAHLQERYERKLQESRATGAKNTAHDWDGMERIFTTLRSAFNDQPRAGEIGYTIDD